MNDPRQDVGGRTAPSAELAATNEQVQPGDDRASSIRRIDARRDDDFSTAPVLEAAETSSELAGKARARRLDLRVILGSLHAVRAQACAVGLFRGVAPGGAARDIDERVNGSIADAVHRKLFRADLGSVYPLPVVYQRLRSPLVVLVGLGDFNRFVDPEDGAVVAKSLRLAGQALVRSLVQWGIEHVATVALGVGSGVDVRKSLRHFLEGALCALEDDDPNHHFRGISFCETLPERFDDLAEALDELVSEGFFGTRDVDPSVRRDAAPSDEGAPGSSAANDPVYLLVRHQNRGRSPLRIHASILGAGEHAAVVSGIVEVDGVRVDRVLSEIEDESFTFSAVPRFGERLASLVLHPDVRAALERPEVTRGRRLVVVHDEWAARLPWEMLTIGAFPGWSLGVSRQHASASATVRWIEQRRADRELHVLVVANPTGDLPQAAREGAMLRRILESARDVRVTLLDGFDASRARLARELDSGVYDAVHYAGHAYFDERNPEESGLLCHDGVLSAGEVSRMIRLPSLVFFNACNTARMAETRGARATRRGGLRQCAGLGEALIRGGVASFLGTSWPVESLAAEVFARTLYRFLRDGASLGYSVMAARAALYRRGSADWSNYQLVGSPDFSLKRGNH